VVAGAFFAADRAVDTRRLQPRGELRAQQQMVKSQPRVALEAVADIVPESVDALARMLFAQRVGPAQLDQAREGCAALRLDQRVIVP
jgi:hypothetical protein